MSRDSGLDTLLEMDGEIFRLEDGSWTKIEARECEISDARPHGIRYSLTLHDRFNRRIFGIDNAHAVKPKRKKYGGHKRNEFDHSHVDENDEGTPYEFHTAGELLEDFWKGVDERVSDA